MNKTLFACIIIIALIIFCYGETQYFPFHFDDYVTIVNNDQIKSLDGLKEVWKIHTTRFLLYCSLAWNYQWSRLDALSYHNVNIFLHVATSLLLYGIVLTLFQTPKLRKHKYPAHTIALFSAGLFACHPIQTQAVTYIIQRTTTMAAFFYLGTIFFYLRARLEMRDSERKNRVVIFFSFAFFAALCASFTKESSLTIVCMVFLVEALFFSNGTLGKKRYLMPSAFFVCQIILLFSYMYSRSNRGSFDWDFIDASAMWTPLQYAIAQCQVYFTYFRLIFFPFHQHLDYFSDPELLTVSFKTVSCFVSLCLVVFLAIWIRKSHVLLSFGILWFFITMVVESSCIPIRDLINEHRLYLSLPGVTVCFTVVSFSYARMWNFLRMGLCVSLLIACIMVCKYQNAQWSDSLSIWLQSLKNAPQKTRIHKNILPLLSQRGEAKHAKHVCLRLLYLYPQNVSYHINYAKIIAQENPDDALSMLYELKGESPQDEQIKVALSSIHLQKGDLQLAMGILQEAAEEKPTAELLNNLGVLYSRTKNHQQAIVTLQQAIDMQPHLSLSYINIGNAYLRLREPDKAVRYLHQGLYIHPKNVQGLNSLGVAYRMLGDEQTAQQYFTKVLRIDPRYQKARENLMASRKSGNKKK